MQLGHVHLKVSDLREAVDFYRDVLGLEIEEQSDRYVFLRHGDEHHSLALQEVRGESRSSRDRPGLYHVAFEVEHEDELREVYRAVRGYIESITPVDQGISRSIYFSDPSGNGVEVYVDTRSSTGVNQWNGRSEPFEVENSS